ncbi:MAG: TetR/AcrR family transcriptional regulator [Dehalococcoidia bacterium]|nr:TetR/AcrR family transcriptional regulator [Dehalococcoidia bacterium]
MKVEGKSTKALIMHAALDIFSKEDFEKATMRYIAEKAGVTTSNIYKHFKNKDDLYVQLISTIIERTSRELDMHLAGLADTRNKIYQMTHYYLNYFQDNVYIAQLVYARTNLSYWYEFEKAYKTAKASGSLFLKIMEEGQRKGELRGDLNLNMLGHIYHGALRHMVVHWLYNQDRYRLSDLADGFAQAIYEASRSKETGKETFVCPFMKRDNL